MHMLCDEYHTLTRLKKNHQNYWYTVRVYSTMNISEMGMAKKGKSLKVGVPGCRRPLIGPRANAPCGGQVAEPLKLEKSLSLRSTITSISGTLYC